jgi:predicted AlkP superfamily phosphohydrolase/phosphomutase
MLALLQFDATSPSTIERLLAEGRLPNLAELRERGRWGALARSTNLFVETGGYASLYSGYELGDHGVYCPFHWWPSEQRLRFLDNVPTTPPTVWDRLSRAGRRSLVIDPYEGWGPKETAGLHLLTGWQFRHKLIHDFSTPRRESRALARRHGRAPVVEYPYGQAPVAKLLDLRRAFLEAPQRLAAVTTELVARQRFDLVWVTFVTAHFTGHYFWDLSRLDAADLDAATRRKLETALVDAHEAVDAALGRIVRAFPEDADVIVFAPNGMAPNPSRSDFLPNMLEAVLAGAPAGSTRRGKAPGSSIWRLRATLPAGLRAAATRPLPSSAVRALTSRLFLRGVDWSRTKAFAVPGDLDGHVRLNLRGRERDGIVDPAEATELMDEIATGLLTFRDDDGAPAVAAVHRVKDELPTGPLLDQLPDLAVEWSRRPSIGVRSVSSPRFGDVVRPGIGSGRSGNHTPESWALVTPGASRAREPGRPAMLVDLAATACALAGVEAGDLPGEPLLERA